jgi:hypothetical protein
MRRSLLGAAVLTALLPIAAACSGSDSTTDTSTTGAATTTEASAGTSSDENVQWVDKVCGEIVGLTEAQTTAPPDLQDPDPAKTLQAFDVYISSNIDAVEDTIAGLKDVGPSPIDGGDEALTALVTGLEALKTGYETTKSKFASVDGSDPAAAQAAILEAFAGLSAGGEEFGKAFEEVGENPAIEAAGNEAPNCQKLEDVGSEPTTTTTS